MGSIAKGNYNDTVKWGGVPSYTAVVETKLSDAIDVDGTENFSVQMNGVITTGSAEIVVSNDGVNYDSVQAQQGGGVQNFKASGVLMLAVVMRGQKWAKVRTIIGVTGGGTLTGVTNAC